MTTPTMSPIPSQAEIIQRLGAIETLYELRLLAHGAVQFSPEAHEKHMRVALCNFIETRRVRMIEEHHSQGRTVRAFDMLTREIEDVATFRDALADFVAACPAVHWPVIGLMSQLLRKSPRRSIDDDISYVNWVMPEEIAELVERTRLAMRDASIWSADYEHVQDRILPGTKGKSRFTQRDMANFMAHTDAVMTLILQEKRKGVAVTAQAATEEDFARLVAWAKEYRAKVVAFRRDRTHWAHHAVTPRHRAEWMAANKETIAARKYAALTEDEKWEGRKPGVLPAGVAVSRRERKMQFRRGNNQGLSASTLDVPKRAQQDSLSLSAGQAGMGMGSSGDTQESTAEAVTNGYLDGAAELLSRMSLQ